jgi:hypothetical protein
MKKIGFFRFPSLITPLTTENRNIWWGDLWGRGGGAAWRDLSRCPWRHWSSPTGNIFDSAREGGGEIDFWALLFLCFGSSKNESEKLSDYLSVSVIGFEAIFRIRNFLRVSDPDHDLTFQKVSDPEADLTFFCFLDPDPTFFRILDPDTTYIFPFSRRRRRSSLKRLITMSLTTLKQSYR